MRHSNGAAGRLDPQQWALVRAAEPELDDHGVVGVVQRDQLIALVWEGRSGLVEVPAHLGFAVVDLAGRDDLVAGVRERVQRRVEVVNVLRLHVLAYKPLTELS